MKVIGNYINGENVASESKRTAPVFNPATGEQTKLVSLATVSETEAAISTAQTAFTDWSNQPPLSRSRVMFRFKALMEENVEQLAEMITLEHGKVLSDAKGELTRGIEVVEFACLLKGEHSLNLGRGVDSFSLMGIKKVLSILPSYS